MATPRTSRAAHGSAKTLCIDIGGTGLKTIVLDAKGEALSERARVPTPRPATPDAVLTTLRPLIQASPAFDRVSVGVPGVVKRHVVMTAPNLDDGWAGFALGAALEGETKKPTRVLNDAGVQGYGVIEGRGTEIILTLGTGMGCAIFVDGVYVPNVELAHHPFRHGRTYEEHIGKKALEKVGKRRWNERVREVLEVLIPIFNPDVVYLGGGNAKKLKGDLPELVKVTDNVAGLLGGIALWRY
ncbi:MAG: ROK family protein [Polyangiaceae bacterium]|nr:ROK family protein [Polyangiaceae bacterium]